MDRYDLIIIGGGPAGYTAAERAGKAGFKVLLFEKEKTGGVCLNEGCIPTKTILHSAKVAGYLKSAKEYGVDAAGAGIIHEAVVSRKQRVIKRLGLGVNALLKSAGATVINAEATILRKQDDLFIVSASGEEYVAENILIATGSRAFLPPVKGLLEARERGYILTAGEILDLKEIPQKLTVVGGGAVGLEFAEYFKAAGSEVSVIELLPAVAFGNEPEISEILKKALVKKGIAVYTGTRVTEISGGLAVCERAGETFTIEGDKILVAAGRKPSTGGLGLENIGVITERGAVITDSCSRTNIKGIYAAGDVNGKSMLAHTAYREAEVAINAILGIEDSINYDAIPSVIYTAPEVAKVGETEESAIKKGIKVKTASLPLTFSGRFVAENKELDGMVKLIADADRDILIGANIIGSYASEIIAQAAAFIDLAVPVSRIKKLVFPHPTVAEIIRETAFSL